MATITLPNGITLDPDNAQAVAAQEYAQSKGLNNLRVFLSIQGERQEYLIVDGQTPVFASPSLEAIGAHIDMMALAIE